MSDVVEVDELAPAKPKLWTVLGLLSLTSLTFSYLGAYAVAGALVEADVLHRWRPDADPRPKWLGIGFFSLLLLFLIVCGIVRFLSQRQLREIDEMSDEAELQA
jgi:ABC-type branched-subunit amino acid transport system permease subunit